MKLFSSTIGFTAAFNFAATVSRRLAHHALLVMLAVSACVTNAYAQSEPNALIDIKHKASLITPSWKWGEPGGRTADGEEIRRAVRAS
jgi:hypothetical protein